MFFIFIFFFVFVSCSTEEVDIGQVFARVGDKTLTKKDIGELKKKGLVSEGSVSHLVNSWVRKTLLYEAAINSNLDKDEVLVKKSGGSVYPIVRNVNCFYYIIFL